jgi:hypothetical protein
MDVMMNSKYERTRREADKEDVNDRPVNLLTELLLYRI